MRKVVGMFFIFTFFYPYFAEASVNGAYYLYDSPDGDTVSPSDSLRFKGAFSALGDVDSCNIDYSFTIMKPGSGLEGEQGTFSSAVTGYISTVYVNAPDEPGVYEYRVDGYLSDCYGYEIHSDTDWVTITVEGQGNPPDDISVYDDDFSGLKEDNLFCGDIRLKNYGDVDYYITRVKVDDGSGVSVSWDEQYYDPNFTLGSGDREWVGSFCGTPQSTGTLRMEVHVKYEGDYYHIDTINLTVGPNCSDECSGTSTGCVDGDTRWYCSENDSDPCRDKINQNCSNGYVCNDGSCVPSCSDECNSGSTGCVDGDTYWYCGEKNDGDPCLDVISPNCPSGYICNDGACIQCNQQCSPGESECTSNNSYWYCSDSDRDGCYNKTFTNCPVDKICDNGNCVNPCTPNHHKACVDNLLVTYNSCDEVEGVEDIEDCAAMEPVCMSDADGEGYYHNGFCSTEDLKCYYADTERCPHGCEDAECLPDPCEPKHSYKTCDGDILRWYDACDQPQDEIENCLAREPMCSTDNGGGYYYNGFCSTGLKDCYYANFEACPAGACTNGTCTCEHECSSNQTGCVNGNISWYCGEKNDGDPCLDVIEINCSNNQMCDGGSCVECTPNDHKACVGDVLTTYDSCGNIQDQDNCAAMEPICMSDADGEGYYYNGFCSTQDLICYYNDIERCPFDCNQATNECIVCTPNWNCNYSCRSGNAVDKICTDSNDCGTDEGDPSRVIVCEQSCHEGECVVVEGSVDLIEWPENPVLPGAAISFVATFVATGDLDKCYAQTRITTYPPRDTRKSVTGTISRPNEEHQLSLDIIAPNAPGDYVYPITLYLLNCENRVADSLNRDITVSVIDCSISTTIECRDDILTTVDACGNVIETENCAAMEPICMSDADGEGFYYNGFCSTEDLKCYYADIERCPFGCNQTTNECIVCTPDWECTYSCRASNSVNKYCTDSNDCGTDTGNPSRTIICEQSCYEGECIVVEGSVDLIEWPNSAVSPGADISFVATFIATGDLDKCYAQASVTTYPPGDTRKRITENIYNANEEHRLSLDLTAPSRPGDYVYPISLRLLNCENRGVDWLDKDITVSVSDCATSTTIECRDDILTTVDACGNVVESHDCSNEPDVCLSDGTAYLTNSTCSNQTENCIYQDEISCEFGCDVGNGQCNPDPCIPEWDCGEWSPCYDNRSYRDCVDIEECQDPKTESLWCDTESTCEYNRIEWLNADEPYDDGDYASFRIDWTGDCGGDVLKISVREVGFGVDKTYTVIDRFVIGDSEDEHQYGETMVFYRPDVYGLPEYVVIAEFGGFDRDTIKSDNKINVTPYTRIGAEMMLLNHSYYLTRCIGEPGTTTLAFTIECQMLEQQLLLVNSDTWFDRNFDAFMDWVETTWIGSCIGCVGGLAVDMVLGVCIAGTEGSCGIFAGTLLTALNVEIALTCTICTGVGGEELIFTRALASSFAREAIAERIALEAVEATSLGFKVVRTESAAGGGSIVFKDTAGALHKRSLVWTVENGAIKSNTWTTKYPLTEYPGGWRALTHANEARIDLSALNNIEKLEWAKMYEYGLIDEVDYTFNIMFNGKVDKSKAIELIMADPAAKYPGAYSYKGFNPGSNKNILKLNPYLKYADGNPIGLDGSRIEMSRFTAKITVPHETGHAAYDQLIISTVEHAGSNKYVLANPFNNLGNQKNNYFVAELFNDLARIESLQGDTVALLEYQNSFYGVFRGGKPASQFAWAQSEWVGFANQGLNDGRPAIAHYLYESLRQTNIAAADEVLTALARSRGTSWQKSFLRTHEQIVNDAHILYHDLAITQGNVATKEADSILKWYEIVESTSIPGDPYLPRSASYPAEPGPPNTGGCGCSFNRNKITSSSLWLLMAGIILVMRRRRKY